MRAAMVHPSTLWGGQDNSGAQGSYENPSMKREETIEERKKFEAVQVRRTCPVKRW